MKINAHYQDLEQSYLFANINRKVAAYAAAHPEKSIIRMGIGDVTRPLAPIVIEALHKGVNDMAAKETFHGYGPEQGYDFLRERVQSYYARIGVELAIDEIFISDGAKSDVGNILDLFDVDNTVLVPDPVYPVYVDTNIMAGRTIRYMQACESNGFLPDPPEEAVDIIYLCSPNNPTGAVYDREQLKRWVDYAKKNDAVILFDSAYEAFVATEELPRSIYEIEGAKECAVEFCSLSKTAGFTGTRCGYTIVPKALEPLNHMWLRRQTTKFNGVSYIIQCGAAEVFTEEGIRQTRENLAYYMRNAKVIADTPDALGIWYTGGKYSPYIWMRCPNGMDSWSFFDLLLEEAGIVGTPGAGFGKQGEGYFRLTAFSTYENTVEAMRRLKDLLQK